MCDVSVIIPTYKPQSYLWQCLDSLVSQTLDKSLFEIIIVLNGCKEPWETQIDTYIKKNMTDLNVRLLQLDKPGVSNARNTGIDMAVGEYIAFIDDDDYISPCYLKELLSLSTDGVLALSYELAFDEECGCCYPYYITKDYDKYANSGNIPFYRPRRLFNGPVYKLIPRSVIGDRRFDESFKNGEDSLFMFLISDAFDKAVFSSKEATYYRRFRNDSATMKKRNTAERLRNSFGLVRRYITFYLKNPRGYRFSFLLTRIMGAVKSIWF